MGRLTALWRLAPLIALAALASQEASGLSVPERSETLRGYDRKSVVEAMERRRLDSLEGVWNYPEERVTFAIERIQEETLPTYRIVVMETEDASVDCGSVAGYMQSSADPGKLRLWLYTLITDDVLTNPVECVAEIAADGMILIQRQRLKFRVSANLSRFLPSLFSGLRIYPRVESATINPGLRRIWPGKQKTEFLIF